jgi:hypothetical protein
MVFMVRAHWSARAISTALFASCLHGACSPGVPGSPKLELDASAPRTTDGFEAGDSPAATAAVVTIGPSPLRRMTNAEYLNALHDLFPSLSPMLPELPADVPVAGFDNAAESQQASDVRIARYEAIANLYAEAATTDTPSVTALTACADWSSAELATACAAQFVEQVGRRLFRRPLSDAESQRFLTRFLAWQTAVDFPGAVELTLAAMLQSPQFLYRPEPVPTGVPVGAAVPVEAYAMASRLSFLLWQSIPDDELRPQVKRMLEDPRGKRSLWSFHRQWMGLDRILLPEGSMRTPAVDPQWTTATQTSAVIESELFVENVLGQGGTFRDLLTSQRAWVYGEMARIYGFDTPADPMSWTEVTLPPSERAGLLTRTAFLAGYSHAAATSPPVRGNGIELRLLCSLPISPPPGVDLSQPMASPDVGPQTNRMLFAARTSPAACQSCHAALNGFGFGLEHYDAAGHFQKTDHGITVDASGTILGTDVDGPFDGAIELSNTLATSAVVYECATRQWLRFALGRAPVGGEQDELARLSNSFMTSDGDVRALLVDLVTTPSFRMTIVEEN